MKTEAFPRAWFVSFEGVDGCGKSTLLFKLAEWLDEARVPYVRTREPGGTPLGEKIRDLLLSPHYGSINQEAEVLLYTASRAQLAQEIIRPSLERGTWVLVDRYIDATLAYQGYGRGLELEPLRDIQEWATKGLWPHRTILLDCDIDIAWARLQSRNIKLDRIEQEDRGFHQRVRQGYLDLARTNPNRFLVLDGARSLDEVIDEFYSTFWLPITRAAFTQASH